MFKGTFQFKKLKKYLLRPRQAQLRKMDILFNLQSENDFRIVIADLVENLYDIKSCNEILDENTILIAKEELRNLIFESNIDKEAINDILMAKSYDTQKIQILIHAIEKHYDKLVYMALVNHNSAFGEALESFDWNLKLVYGTSELKNLYYPIFQIALTNIHKSVKIQRIYDIKYDTLCKMINTLENIDSS